VRREEEEEEERECGLGCCVEQEEGEAKHGSGTI